MAIRSYSEMTRGTNAVAERGRPTSPSTSRTAEEDTTTRTKLAGNDDDGGDACKVKATYQPRIHNRWEWLSLDLRRELSDMAGGHKAEGNEAQQVSFYQQQTRRLRCPGCSWGGQE